MTTEAGTSTPAAPPPAFDYLTIVVVVGDAGVGKSCMLSRLTKDFFPSGYETTLGVNLFNRTLEAENKKMRLQCWDVSGQEQLRSMTTQYCASAHGVLLVYDVTNRASFVNLRDKWLPEVKRHGKGKMALCLVGAKSDASPTSDDPLQTRQVSIREGEELGKELGIPAIEVSAKSGRNVEAAFALLARDMLSKWGLLAVGEPDESCVVQ